MCVVPLIMALLFQTVAQTPLQKYIAQLYKNNEYYQCIAELRRYSMMAGQDMDYSIAYCYYKGNRLAEAAHILHKSPNKQTRHYLLLAHIYTSLQQYNDALQMLALCDSFGHPPQQMLVYKNMLAVHVARYDWDAALSFYTSHSDELKEMQEMFTVLNNAKRDAKSPYLAAGLSAILPGTGHCYAQHCSDGLISFVTVAVLAGATYISHAKGNDALMYTFGALAVIGYGGNVYSAYTSALHYNELLYSNYRTKIYNEFLQYNPEQFLPQWMTQ
ncbi:MAG: hypothetical protein N3F66_05745 [Spirochaetes bacterium]|nr:hypothetical protein [Spirochaetota bacterium]